MSQLYPLLLEPSLHTKVWGGRKLQTLLGKDLPTDEPYGEAWEMHDTSTVANGDLAGRTIADLVAEFKGALIGNHNDPAEGMPLLVKFLDANDWLSVQVHPDDEQAKALEGDPRGKTEAWIVLAAESDSKLVIGVQPGTTRDAMAAAIEAGTLEEMLVYQPVAAGDVLYVAANTVHALGPGIVIYEIQQSSDMTYRLYDWGRMGLDGQPRELHIEKGVQVSNLAQLPPISRPQVGSYGVATMVDGDYFRTILHDTSQGPAHLNANGVFHALSCIAGRVEVASEGVTITLDKGRSALIPASLGDFVLQGAGQVLRSFQTT